ncbi:hypothetical protein AWC16_13305 [Mycolicibacter longobardus]|uniref:Peptidase n=1 Tax=Mycolicibacter longobardus TaxID=1108812 RepID=A0A1X1YI70_9MYCO|nr:hypothetical protein AWC16_13305 [Mycolicibacter longobardus]
MIASAGLPTAAADDKILLGGGAAIVLNDNALCTLTAVGHDTAGQLVGFTAAHCGGTGSSVVVEGAEDHGTVGTVVAADEGLDYAVIELDPDRVRPIADYEGFGIYGLSPADLSPADPEPAGPDPGVVPEVQHACKLGRGTGLNCFDIGPAGVHSTGDEWWQPGDDGAPVTVDDLLVGMVRNGSVPGAPLTQQGSGIVLFQAILDDVNAKGGPGSGFTLG